MRCPSTNRCVLSFLFSRLSLSPPRWGWRWRRWLGGTAAAAATLHRAGRRRPRLLRSASWCVCCGERTRPNSRCPSDTSRTPSCTSRLNWTRRHRRRRSVDVWEQIWALETIHKPTFDKKSQGSPGFTVMRSAFHKISYFLMSDLKQSRWDSKRENHNKLLRVLQSVRYLNPEE